tara:strand:+ start:1159 stop:1425 length:267 start_codon:yes stop_codon:yes gene_type:complete
MSDFVNKIANAITESAKNMDLRHVRTNHLDEEHLEEGRGKKGQLKQMQQKSRDMQSQYSKDEWGKADSYRKRNKPNYRVVRKKAVWDQ